MAKSITLSAQDVADLQEILNGIGQLDAELGEDEVYDSCDKLVPVYTLSDKKHFDKLIDNTEHFKNALYFAQNK